MSTVIIYPSPDRENGIVVLYPVPFEHSGLTLEQIAMKDVPHGVPFRYVDLSDIPEDHTFFNAFEADFSNPDGHGADHGVGTKNIVVGWNEDGTPITEWRDE